jgi:hypothetical protein
MDPIVDNRNHATATSRCAPARLARDAERRLTVSSPRPIDPYPRNRAGIVRSYVGKKVTLSTIDFHYLVGRLRALGEDDVLTVDVGKDTVRLARRDLASIQEADPALAEYVK